MRISDWSSDVCSSDLLVDGGGSRTAGIQVMQKLFGIGNARTGVFAGNTGDQGRIECLPQRQIVEVTGRGQHANQLGRYGPQITGNEDRLAYGLFEKLRMCGEIVQHSQAVDQNARSEEPQSEL